MKYLSVVLNHKLECELTLVLIEMNELFNAIKWCLTSLSMRAFLEAWMIYYSMKLQDKDKSRTSKEDEISAFYVF